MIKTVLLDLDDTIFDFHKAEKIAISKTLAEFGVEPCEKTLRRYSEINAGLWKKLEAGELTREEVLTKRFTLLFRELGIERDCSDVKKSYEGKLAIGHYFIEGAEELLETLYGRYKLYLASNGTATVQDSRIASSPIPKYFEKIFISEKVGCNKPSAEFFERCFKEIPNFKKSEAIIVGDSLSSDIQGGINAGITTCLFNQKSEPNNTGIKPDYEIKKLSELPALLEKL